MKNLIRNIFFLDFLFKQEKGIVIPQSTPTPTNDIEQEKKQAVIELEKWIEDPINKGRIIETAKIFDDVMKHQWFDLKDVLNKTNYRTTSSAYNILNTMKLAKCLIVEERASKEVFRITITGKNRIKLLELQRKKLEKQLEEINKELGV